MVSEIHDPCSSCSWVVLGHETDHETYVGSNWVDMCASFRLTYSEIDACQWINLAWKVVDVIMLFKTKANIRQHDGS